LDALNYRHQQRHQPVSGLRPLTGGTSNGTSQFRG
jgi:hypothetical protein